MTSWWEMNSCLCSWRNTGLDSCQTLVITFSSTGQHITLFLCVFLFDIYGAPQLVQAVSNLPVKAGGPRDMGLIPGSGRSPWEGNGHPLQYSCLGNSMDRGAWQATVLGVTKSWTRLSTRAHNVDIESTVNSTITQAWIKFIWHIYFSP